MNAKLVSLNLRRNRSWARYNHKRGIRRWAVARSVFYITFQESKRGELWIDDDADGRIFVSEPMQAYRGY